MPAITAKPALNRNSTEEPTEREAPDPTILVHATTSLGSYCWRWRLAVSGQASDVWRQPQGIQ